MSDFKDEIIKFLTNGQGFIMESFLSESRNTLMWLAIKSKPEGDYVILITNDFDEKLIIIASKQRIIRTTDISFTVQTFDEVVKIDTGEGK